MRNNLHATCPLVFGIRCEMVRATLHFLLLLGGVAIALILVDRLVGHFLRNK